MKKGEWHYYATFYKKPLGILFAQWKHRAAVQSVQNLTGIEFGDVVKTVNEQRCEKEGFFNITRKIIDAQCPITILFRRPETRLTRFLNCVKKVSDKTVEKKLAEAKQLLKKFEREDAERDELVPSLEKEPPTRKPIREDSDPASSKRKEERITDTSKNAKLPNFLEVEASGPWVQVSSEVKRENGGGGHLTEAGPDSQVELEGKAIAGMSQREALGTRDDEELAPGTQIFQL
eukprot:CAMPEP_0185273442 /NCGR_PEP_ID=MMETSP1359-20130426/49535_1 /TAXON_ID=552665 /ORGANISM="Bigelowiella longifila, Strain CCMP242" /LENGTH=232 /DNA_ID=CAMNT_0027866075 /DNA_START=258 /DNA_END=957 /DNA_ORIENTATION=-